MSLSWRIRAVIGSRCCVKGLREAAAHPVARDVEDERALGAWAAVGLARIEEYDVRVAQPKHEGGIFRGAQLILRSEIGQNEPTESTFEYS